MPPRLPTIPMENTLWRVDEPDVVALEDAEPPVEEDEDDFIEIVYENTQPHQEEDVQVLYEGPALADPHQENDVEIVYEGPATERETWSWVTRLFRDPCEGSPSSEDWIFDPYVCDDIAKDWVFDPSQGRWIWNTESDSAQCREVLLRMLKTVAPNPLI